MIFGVVNNNCEAVIKVAVAASEVDPLIGMSLLYGFRVQIDVVEGGVVAIEAIN